MHTSVYLDIIGPQKVLNFDNLYLALPDKGLLRKQKIAVFPEYNFKMMCEVD